MAFHVAVLGTGAISDVHLRSLYDSPHVTKVTLVGRNPETLAQRGAEIPGVETLLADYAQVLDDPSVDVVDIVLPHHLHAPASIAALAAGKHVICEKPGAISLDEMRAVEEAAVTSGKRRLVVMNQLYNPLVTEVRRIIDAGDIGRPFLAVENAFSHHDRQYRDDTWRTRLATSGGGVLIDGGFHLVYRHLYFLAGCAGLPQWVMADAPQLNVVEGDQREATIGEDAVNLTVGYGSSLRIFWSHAWTLAANVMRSRQSFVAGERGTLEFTDDEKAPLALCGESSRREIAIDGRCDRETTMTTCLWDAVAALAEDRELLHDGGAIYRMTLAVILAAYQSTVSGSRVMLDSQDSGA